MSDVIAGVVGTAIVNFPLSCFNAGDMPRFHLSVPVAVSILAICLAATRAASVAAAPLILYDPAGPSPLSQAGAGGSSAAFTASAPPPGAPVACGGFGAPCGFLSTPLSPVHSVMIGGQKFEWGGAVSTGIGFASHGTATDIAVSGWLKSADSTFALFLAVDHETLRALQGQSFPSKSFGQK